jgi:hypothetical protein
MISCHISDNNFPELDLPADVKSTPISDTGEIYKILQKYARQTVEYLFLITLDAESRIIAARIVCIGGENEGTVSLHEITRIAVADRAFGVVVAHNHPTGDLLPSIADQKFVYDLRERLDALEIEFTDSIIMNGEKFQSMFAPRKIKERRVSLVKDWIVRLLSMLAGIFKGCGVLMLALAVLIIYTRQPISSENVMMLMILMYPAGWILESIMSGVNAMLERTL